MKYLIVFIYLIFTLYALTEKWTKATKYLIVVCMFQNIVILFLSRFLDNTTYSIIVMIKEAFVLGYIFKYIRSFRSTTAGNLFSIIAVLVIICYFAADRTEGRGALASLRQLYLPFIFYIYGTTYRSKEKDRIEISSFFVKCCLGAVYFGFVEMVFGVWFWRTAGIERYAYIKGNAQYLRFGLYRSFYTFDIGGSPIRRMASTLVDPVILGQLLALAFLISVFTPWSQLYKTRSYKIYVSVILAIGLICTLAKGGLVIMAMSSLLLLKKVSKKRVLSNLLTLPLVLIGILYFGYGIVNDLSSSNHLNGLISGFKVMLKYPFGMGIGSGGNAAHTFGESMLNSRYAGSESFIGAVMVQLGIWGLFLYLWLFVYMISHSNRAYDLPINRIYHYAFFSLVLTSFVNNTSISFTSCYLYCIMTANIEYSYRNNAIRKWCSDE